MDPHRRLRDDDGCGVGLPSSEEIDAILAEEGIERTPFPDSPDKVGRGKKIGMDDVDALLPDDFLESLNKMTDLPEDDDGLLVGSDALLQAGFDVGRKLKLPDSVPTVWNPANNQPYAGARRGRIWNRRTRRFVDIIDRKVDGNMQMATYWGHGRTNIWYGVDMMFSHFNQKANQREEDFGDALINWIVGNWHALNVNYVTGGTGCLCSLRKVVPSKRCCRAPAARFGEQSEPWYPESLIRRCGKSTTAPSGKPSSYWTGCQLGSVSCTQFVLWVSCTSPLLSACLEKLEAAGKKFMVLIWDNAS